MLCVSSKKNTTLFSFLSLYSHQLIDGWTKILRMYIIFTTVRILSIFPFINYPNKTSTKFKNILFIKKLQKNPISHNLIKHLMINWFAFFRFFENRHNPVRNKIAKKRFLMKIKTCCYLKV